MAEVALTVAISAAISIGSYLLLSGSRQSLKNRVEGNRLGSSTLTTSTEGEGITKLFGRQRLDGQVIWATQFKEKVNVTTSTTSAQSGGKGLGGGGGGGGTTTETTTYTYSISLAIAFCEGNHQTSLNRVWADGKEIDLSSLSYRFYPGSQTQGVDRKIEEVQGAGNVPAYRGVAYIVIEDMELADYGNRVPQITAEITVPIVTDDPVDIQNSGRAFCLTGTGEEVYSPSQVNLVAGMRELSIADIVLNLYSGETSNPYITRPDNINNALRTPDVVRSLTNLTRILDHLETVLVVVPWFGSDLRVQNCTLLPKTVDSGRRATPAWSVSSYNPTNTAEISKHNDRPAFGGTPSDRSITELIHYLGRLGKRVVFCPSILMDIPAGNTFSDPYSDHSTKVGQPAYPGRGMITCDPAPGYAGSPDGTLDVSADINYFMGQYQAMVLHYARLCSNAGGVDTFLLGTGLSGLTRIRASDTNYPVVDRLRDLADFVHNIVSSNTKLSYAADWDEWHSYETPNGDTAFHLDPLWSYGPIDFIGVNNFAPLSDWRDGTQHLDYDGTNGPVSEFDPDYLSSQIEGGEHYDYTYTSQINRDNQIRTPITDEAYGKPWVYRHKDFRSWWSNTHYNRYGGVEAGGPTNWIPHSKPIWFTALGAPAVNKGTNQPDAFYDPKATQSTFPLYSSGQRDDYIQRVTIETTLDYWRNNSPSIGGLTMIEPHNMFVWAWDARPYPDYPARSDVWPDGDQWFYGHQLNGRIESAPLPRLVASLCRLAGLTNDQFDVTGLHGSGALVRGYQIDRPETIRSSLETLMQTYLFDGFESEGQIKFILRSNTKTSAISGDDLVVSDNAPVGVTLTRGQETDLPSSVKITFIDEFNDYNTISVNGKTSRGNAQNTEELDVPITLNSDYARSLADSIVQQRWIERQGGSMSLPPSLLRLDPGDAVTFPVGDNSLTGRLTVLALGDQRDSEFIAFDSGALSLPDAPSNTLLPTVANVYGSITVVLMNLPLFTGNEEYPHAPRIAANANPWPGGVDIYRLLSDTTYQFNTRHGFRNPIGLLNTPLVAGPTGVWDRGSVLDVTFDYGALSSGTETTVLESALALGVYNADADEWEIIQFATAMLTGTRTYRVTDLLRGQLGTEHAMPTSYPANTIVVLLEPTILSTLVLTDELSNREQTWLWGPSRYPHTDQTYQSGVFTGKRVGLRPYAPTGVKLATNAANDLIIDWKRRTRFNGDSWVVDEPPLNEETEQYRLRVYAGTTIVHQAITTSPTYTYTAERQVTDFGGVQSALRLDVAHYGSAFGGYGIVNTETHVIGSARV